MAGDINLQPLIDQLFGSSATGAPPPAQVSARPPDWQQSLTQHVDPETQRHERVRNLLANFGQALSSTPGNFLQGVAAGAGKAAVTYNQERDDDAQKRIAAQKLIQEFTDKQQERATGQLKDRYDIGRQVNADAQAKDDRIYTRGRQEKADKLSADRVEIARTRAETDAKRLGAKLPKGLGGPLTEWQQQQTLTALDNLVTKFQTSLGDPLNDEEQTANDAAVDSYRQTLYKRHKFDPDSGAYLGEPAADAAILPTPQSSNEDGKTSLPDAPGAGQISKVIGGKTYIKKADGWYEQ